MARLPPAQAVCNGDCGKKTNGRRAVAVKTEDKGKEKVAHRSAARVFTPVGRWQGSWGCADGPTRQGDSFVCRPNAFSSAAGEETVATLSCGIMAANAETMTTNAVANYGAGGGGSGRFVFAEELDFYLDMALNECQRWLEAVTRERFIDDDDFLYSLRYGTQLRQVVNRVLPDCFEWTAGVGCDDFGYGGVRRLASAEDREDWVAHLLLICWRRLRFAPEELFQPEDLDCAESSAAYFDNSRHDRPTDESPSTSLLRADADRLRRVCATIARLAVACAGDARIPRFDQSALEPLLAYHQSLYRSGRERPLCHPLDRPLRDVRQALRSAVDIICAEEETALRPVSPNSDEGIGTMVDCVNEKVSKYLAELPSCDQMSYGDAKSSRSNSPTMTRHRNYDAHIPTRLVTKTATSVAHNPLQFIAAKTNAIALSEQAKQQLQIVDEQKKLRTETLLVTHEEEETTWLSNLDQWRSKRKSVLRNKTSEEMSADHDHIDAEARSQQKLVRKFSEEPRFFGNNHSPDNPTVKVSEATATPSNDQGASLTTRGMRSIISVGR
uniref:Uncharacterized protein n=1 Tax=Plectus sambesii TaxID=2011161 RepID=A0A914UZS1_9BILA